MYNLLFIGLYVLLMVGVGLWGLRRTKTLDDFFLGGRSFGPWITAFSYGTNYFSAVVFVGFAGRFGWNQGLDSLWIGIGNAVLGAFLAWLILGKHTRRMTRNLDVMTMPEFFFRRYGMYTMKPFAAMVIFIFLLPYSAGVYKGLAELLVGVFPGVPFNVAIIIMAALTGLYLILGGYFAVAITDCIQGVIMIGGALALVYCIADVSPAGNIPDAVAMVSQKYAEHASAGKTNPGPWYLLPSLVAMTSFGCWAMPQMVHKFYAIKDEGIIIKGAIVCTVFALIIGGAAYFTGSTSHLFFDSLSDLKVPAGVAPEDTIVPTMLVEYLPKSLLGLMLVLLLSASMSTLSGIVLVSSSAIAIDLYKGVVDPKVSHRTSVTLMRFLSAMFIAISYFIATHRISFIETLMSLSWGSIAGAFLAPFIFGLFWRRTTAIGAFAGMCSGIATTVVLFFTLDKSLASFGACVGMLVPFIVVPVVSLFTKPVPQNIVDKAFSISVK